ncbi:MAG: hypothetical protein ACI9E1_000473 [Cryomorphaceae bacterium]|jgi:hypothetical protein
MQLLKMIILPLCISSVSYAGDLIANINYGESRDTVASKLSKSKVVKSSMPSNMFARIGLNGSFSTTRDLAGLKFTLYFDWTESSGLKEITYRSDALVSYSYDQNLKQKWQYAINLLSAIHGRASNAGAYPKKNDVKPDSIQFSHEWKTDNGYVYLGVGQQAKKYSLNITFSKVSLSL